MSFRFVPKSVTLNGIMALTWYYFIIILLTFIMRLLLQNKNIGAVQKYKLIVVDETY